MPPLKGTRKEPDVTSDLIGRVFEERYRIERQLGRGGIGVVYYALDQKLGDRPVAIKVLSEVMGMRKAQRQRFEREAKALAALNHPNVVSVIDFGVADETPYLVMELLRGEPLSQVLADDAPLPWERALHLMNQTLAGLCYVHERGIVHRDLKPGNLFVQRLPGMGERVKLLDFGLAKFLDPGDDAVTVTRSGDIFGTPGYMPPEQLLGKPVDTSADVYSACVLFYEMLAGRKPFIGSGLADVLKKQLAGEVPRLIDADTGRRAHPALDALLARGLAVDPEARFRDARALAEALTKLPPHCVEVANDEERAAQRNRAHEAATRIEAASELPTVADAKRTPLVESQEPVRPTPVEHTRPGAFTRALTAMKALVTGLLRASAVVVALASVVVIVISGLAIYLASRPELEESREALRKALPSVSPATPNDVDVALAKTGSEAPPPTTLPSTAETGAEKPTKVAARDPWRGPIPPVLRSARAQVLKKQKGNEKTLNALRRYNGDHPGDARGHLLLAGLCVNRSWYSDAVQQYEHAFRADVSARGDAHALHNLLSLAQTSEAVWSRARRLLVRTYGPELRAPIERALSTTQRADARARLTALLSEVTHAQAEERRP